MRVFTAILFIYFVFSAGLEAHPVHVSVCNLEFGKEDVQLSVKLFRDDLQLAVEHETGRKTELSTIDNQQEEVIICDYVKNRLKIFVGSNDEVDLIYKGYMVKDEAVWLNFSMKSPDRIKKLRLENSLLVETFHDQTNLLILSFLGKQNGYRFTYNQRVIEPEIKGLKEYK